MKDTTYKSNYLTFHCDVDASANQYHFIFKDDEGKLYYIWNIPNVLCRWNLWTKNFLAEVVEKNIIISLD